MYVKTIVKGGAHYCDISVHAVRGADEIEVNRMFNDQGKETLDPTEATEIETDHPCKLMKLEAGDEIYMVVEFLGDQIQQSDDRTNDGEPSTVA